MAPQRKVKAGQTTDDDTDVHSLKKSNNHHGSIDHCEAESETDIQPSPKKKQLAKKITKKMTPPTKNL
ncbi:hypothetical protein Pst134EA_011157 [Puccinia striiformis f. sp. tritici]|uniref:hypothetical protein n=1 Tax=Puccinia striiformis f. sp. tritici TaxID=168172 RepID=UPI002008BED6|nr:hypothetical protein Pst134EA_011157 [Puccinia striiformis f. sp. tritici]KAH9455932.1 hypothetical protein Pst134EB_012159 [Puccinia striiformis f. sp. tritici]KAH9467516.1 hypothetical protein Pst134EA_011157 [Puccinia striiformis f. sp. tritici]KAI9609664.1 hypothetical protein KEM48_002834 [Puccinia striiformis f. sp. tritici PST-130]